VPLNRAVAIAVTEEAEEFVGRGIADQCVVVAGYAIDIAIEGAAQTRHF